MPAPMRRAAVLTALAIGSFAVAPPMTFASDPPAAPRRIPCSRPEFRQFDFWLGDWVVTTPDGKPAGTNLVSRPLGQCVLQEHWQGEGGMAGESYNIYDRIGGHWHQTWVDDQGTYLSLEGGLVGGNMVLTGPARLLGGKPTIDRITWRPVSADEVHQEWDQSSDGGTNWTSAFHGVYRRRR